MARLPHGSRLLAGACTFLLVFTVIEARPAARAQIPVESDRWVTDDRPSRDGSGDSAVNGGLSEDRIVFAWGDCGGGSYDLVVADWGHPYRLLSQLSTLYISANPLAWAPDGTAFVTTNYPRGMAIVDVATGIVTPITYGDDDWPSWSNDGSQIAFTRLDYELETSDLWVVHSDGSGLERLTDTPDLLEFTPSWAPDDSQLVYVAGNPDNGGLLDVWVMDRDGTDSSNVTNLPPYAQRSYWGPVWSPASREIAVILQTPNYPDIVVMGVDGSSWRNLTEDSSFLSAVDPAWSPDGTRIAHVRQDVNGDGDIWVMDPSGGNAIRVTDLEGCEYSPVWEPYPGAFPGSEEWVALFSDVNPETSRWPEVVPHRFAADIAWLADGEITKGCNPPLNTRFCPDGYVTRAEMAAFLVRALGLGDRLVDPFVDDDGSVFEADIERLAAAGITKGCNPPSNSWFCPDGYVTRGQMAAFLHRALG